MLLFVVGCLNQFAKRSAWRFHVRLHGPGTRAQGGRDLGVEPDLGLPLHRRGRPGRLRHLRPAPVGLGFHTTVAPGLLLAGRRRLLVHRLQGHPCSSLLTLVFECVSVACILALAAVVLFKHGITIDTTIVKAKAMTSTV